MLTCVYCGNPNDAELEVRHGKFVCQDTKACDERDARSHQAHVAELRRRQRQGDDLTEAERLELAQ